MNKVQHLIKLARRGWQHRHWYKEANAAISESALKLGVSVEEMAQVLALMSPQAQVLRSVRLTVSYLIERRIPKNVWGPFKTQIRHWESTGKIRGPKTAAFAAALLGDDQQVVLDTWMGLALAVDSKKFEVKRVRESAARRVRYGACLMCVPPAEFQAAVWSGVSRANRSRNIPSLADMLRLEISITRGAIHEVSASCGVGPDSGHRRLSSCTNASQPKFNCPI